MAERELDVVVVGAGPAGEVAAGRLADRGLDVAIVEHQLVGGECAFYACMPSKALLRPGELLAEARRIPGVGEAVTGGLDVRAVLERRDEVVHDLDDAVQEPWLNDKGIALVRAQGRLEGERRVRAGDDLLIARRAVVVATGSSPLLPPIDGLREARPWTNREATTAHDVPRRLAVLGGGVVGVELAQAWSTLGSQVTLIEALDRLLAREEPFASAELADALHERGVDLQLSAKAVAVRAEDGQLTVELERGGPVRAEQLLVAVGRRPNTDELGLESVGLEPGKPIPVDESMRVLVKPSGEAPRGRGEPPGVRAEVSGSDEGDPSDWLYAIGDVNGRVLLTHMAKYQARVAVEVILGKDARVGLDGATSPRVVFTDPQVAAVGHTLASAREAGLSVRAIDQPTQSTAGASFVGRSGTRGSARLVVDEDRGVLVGATFTGFEVAELLQGATIAIVGEVSLERLAHAVPSFPTRSEVWLKLLEQLRS